MKQAFALVLVAACAEPTIEMTLSPTAEVRASLNTSCVSAVLVQLDGLNIDSSPDDYLQSCYDVPAEVPHDNWTDLQAAVKGKYNSPLPATGLSAVEVYGYNGTCETLNTKLKPRNADLVFYGFGRNLDDEEVRIDTTGNLDCVRETVTARAIDIDKLRLSNSCTNATFPLAKGVSLSTFNPLPSGRGVDWWGATKMAVDETTGLATFEAAATVVGSSCLVASWTNASLDPRSTSCITPKDQNVCGTPREVPALDPRLWEGARDEPKFEAYGGFVVGVVYNNEIGPIAGAKITFEQGFEGRGEVVYLTRVEEEGAMVIRGAAPGVIETDISGLFGIYTDSLIRVKIEKAGGGMVIRNVGTAGPIQNQSPFTAAMIVKI